MTQKETPAAGDATEISSAREGLGDEEHSTTKSEAGQAGWVVPADPAERNRLIIQGICPLCGGRWRGGPEGHQDGCPNARPAKHSGAGRNWRQGRGRQRYATRARRWRPLDVLVGGGQ